MLELAKRMSELTKMELLIVIKCSSMSKLELLKYMFPENK